MKKNEYVHLLEKLLLAFHFLPNPQFNHLSEPIISYVLTGFPPNHL